MMRKKKIFVMLMAVCSLTAVKTFAQDKDIPQELFTGSGISDSLKEGANSIIRYSNDEVNIKGPGEAVIKHRQLITILNEKADREAEVVLLYNRKFDTYSDIAIRVYDAAGKQIKKYHKSDMYDVAAIDNETLFTDDRVLFLRHAVASYPTTIEVEYEESLSSFINPEAWHIQGNEQAVQNETYKITAKAGMGFRYKCKNISLNPIKVNQDGSETYVWQVSNLKGFKIEEGATAGRVLPKVDFAVDKFDCYGYPGQIDSWQDYGKWVYGLNKDVCTLSPERVAEIKKMTDTIKTDKGKAKFLYDYMHQNMRYVSVQLGIGGYKPFDANFVDQKKYGDCKALANYLYALLKAINIPSNWAVIYRGNNGIPADRDFPVNTFNHEILCIPFKGDTTWVECTGNTLPFGKLDVSTQNRNALLIGEDGGKLVNTPKSTPADNQFNSEAHIVLSEDGGAKAQVKILTSGGYRDDYVEWIPTMKADEQKETVMRLLNIKQASVFDFNPATDKNGVKEIDLNLEYDKFCDIISGDKQFYRTRVIDLCAFSVPILENRKSDFYFPFPMQKSSVTTIDLPAGFEIETLPTSQSLKFTYGNYDITYTYNAVKNQVISIAKFKITNQDIPAAKYTEMQQYIDAVAKAQNKKLVIRKKA